MRFYNVIVEADPAQETEPTVSALVRMDLFFTVPDQFPLAPGQIVSGVLRDLKITRYMKVTEIHELTQEDFDEQVAA